MASHTKMGERKGWLSLLCCSRSSRGGQPLVSVPRATSNPKDENANLGGISRPKSLESIPDVVEVPPEEPPIEVTPLKLFTTPVQQDVKQDLPVTTEDIYDPFLMDMSPRVIGRGSTSSNEKEKKRAPKIKTAMITDNSAEASTKEGFFHYGVTMLRDGTRSVGLSLNSSIPQSTGTAFVPASAPAPPVALPGGTSSSPNLEGDPPLVDRINEIQDSCRSCSSSFRECKLVSYRISDDWRNLNAHVYNALLQYFTGAERAPNQKVEKQWAENVKVLMKNKSARIIEAFKEVYNGELEFQTSYLICQPVFTAQRGMRIDLILRAKVMSGYANTSNSLKYLYSYVERRNNGEASEPPVYASKFVFECLKKHATRTISCTRDVSSMHGDDLHVAASELVSQVSEGDSIEIPVVLMNALGNTNVDTIKFVPITRYQVKSSPESSLDKLHREWYTVSPNSKYLQQLFPGDIDAYSLVKPEKVHPHLKHQITQVAGIDVITSRSKFVATTPGMINEAKNFIGHSMEVLEAGSPIICMLQRVGMQYDRLCHIQLRVGDQVQFYTTKG